MAPRGKRKKNAGTTAAHRSNAPATRGEQVIGNEQVVRLFVELLSVKGAIDDHALARLSRPKARPRLTEVGLNFVSERATSFGVSPQALSKLIDGIQLKYHSDIDRDLVIPPNRQLSPELLDAYSRNEAVQKLLRTSQRPERQVDVDHLLGLPREVKAREAINKRSAIYLSVHDYLKDLEYTEVPAYQRRYVWEEEHLVDLFKDLEAVQTQDVLAGVHFLGTVLIKDRGDSTYQILDGQQRTMTFSIFVAVACRLLRRWGSSNYARDLVRTYLAVSNPQEFKPKFLPSPVDQAAYRTVLESATDSRSEERWIWPDGGGWEQEAKSTVPKVAQYIEERLSEHANSKDLESRKHLVLNWLFRLLYKCAICQFSLFETDDALATFRTLNSRGQRLSNADILKSVACRFVAKTSSHQEFVKSVWDPINESVCPSPRGLDPKRLDLFYTAYAKWLLREPVTKQDVVERVSAHWEECGDLTKIVDSLKLAAQLFTAVVDFGSQQRKKFAGEEDLDDVELGWLWVLSTAGVSQEIVPFLMLQLQARVEGRLKAKQSIEALQFLSGLTVRRGVQLSQSLQGLQKYMAAALRDLRIGTKAPLSILLEHLDTPDQKLSQFTDEAFELHLNEVPLARKRELARAILYRLDLEHRPYDDKRDRTGHKSRAVDQIEHVCPQKLKGAEYWEEVWGKDDHVDWVHRLGNIVLLEPTDNNEVGRKPLDEKIDRFLNGSNVTMTIELGAKLKSSPSWAAKWRARWGVELVRDRTAELARLAVVAFPFPFKGRKY
jgi:hypothetical protein